MVTIEQKDDFLCWVTERFLLAINIFCLKNHMPNKCNIFYYVLRRDIFWML